MGGGVLVLADVLPSDLDLRVCTRFVAGGTNFSDVTYDKNTVLLVLTFLGTNIWQSLSSDGQRGLARAYAINRSSASSGDLID